MSSSTKYPATFSFVTSSWATKWNYDWGRHISKLSSGMSGFNRTVIERIDCFQYRARLDKCTKVSHSVGQRGSDQKLQVVRSISTLVPLAFHMIGFIRTASVKIYPVLHKNSGIYRCLGVVEKNLLRICEIVESMCDESKVQGTIQCQPPLKRQI